MTVVSLSTGEAVRVVADVLLSLDPQTAGVDVKAERVVSALLAAQHDATPTAERGAA